MNNIEKDIKILIANGVNLSQLGSREIDIYGHLSFEEYLNLLKTNYKHIQFDFFQSDNEGELASHIANAQAYDGIILNAGAYTHTSVILADAIRTTSSPVIEVHISNLFGREQYRRQSILSKYCVGFIAGFGLNSYQLAVESILIKKNPIIKLS